MSGHSLLAETVLDLILLLSAGKLKIVVTKLKGLLLRHRQKKKRDIESLPVDRFASDEQVAEDTSGVMISIARGKEKGCSRNVLHHLEVVCLIFTCWSSKTTEIRSRDWDHHQVITIPPPLNNPTSFRR